MRSPGGKRLAPGLLLLCTLPIGCAAPPPAPPPSVTAASQQSRDEAETIQQVAYHEQPTSGETEATLPTPTAVPPVQSAAPSHNSLFAGMKVLSVDALVQGVLARNPTLAQMVAAWEAANARYPQVTSLDDPELAVTLGPATYFSNLVEPAYRVNIGQKYPWPGKLKLRGDQAQAEANAARNEVDDTRLRLIESAKTAFYDYYLVHRAIAVNRENIRLLEEFRDNVKARYNAGIKTVTQQDILQAEVELGRVRERGLLLEQARQIAVARINTLLNLPPDVPLPPPPEKVVGEDGLPGSQALRALALSRRPDLQATANRIRADQAALALANKEFYPDFTPFFMYDRFMGNLADNRPLAYMVGFSMNLPVRLKRRYAAVAEVQARLNQRRAELQARINQVDFAVQQAYAQVEQGAKVVRLYENTVVPAARRNVKAAQDNYAAAKITFLRLLDAERASFDALDRYYQLVADYYRRKAELERSVGGPLTAPATETPAPTPAVPHPAH